MKLNIFYTTAIFCATMLLAAVPVIAGTSAQVHVSATVLPYVNVNAAQSVATYKVNSGDLKRGYVDLPNSLTVIVKTNMNGVVSVFVDNGTGEGRLLVRESGTGTFMNGSLALNTAGHRPGDVISRNYDSRIVLPADTKEGTYALAITMMPAI
jgi:hypothetical protein